MVIFDFEEEETGTEHVVIAISKCVLSGIFRRVQHPCKVYIIFPNGSKLNCLLYAEDLVLVSHSAKGLQKALSILAKYCNDWMLSVNPKKTKVVIFQKQCRKSTLDKYYFQIK